MKNNNATAIIYARTTKSDNPMLEIKRQEAYCRAYCINHGFELADVYFDIDSDKKSSRKGLQGALEDYSDSKKQVVLVVIDYEVIADTLEELDAIETLLEGYGSKLLCLEDVECKCGDEFEAMISRKQNGHE
ncbi:MAG: hypothetical protein DWQ49_12580 [Bacteroidetes bacterium]|nr:MAG: hypothetical protein DWQ49_12580 [Bacteroidota bacterium]